eukprot:COSAG02_NODE_759_length_17490_cov_29.152608_10_plen_948_part_00
MDGVADAESEGSLGAAADAGATDDGTEAVEATRLDDDAAAARIQARHRGRADRRKVAEMNGVADAQSEGTVNAAEADETHSGNDVQSTGMDEDTAAARIQAIQRGKMARKEQQEMTAAATRIQSVHRGKASRRAQPKIEDRLLGWSQDWYIAMQTIATATGVPFMQSKFQDLTAQETAFLKQKFELVKQQRFEGGEADFWKFVASSFSKADLGRTGMLDFESFEKLCASIFGSFGDLQEATGESLQEFFRRADADQSGKVSFAELVAVFVVDEQRSPALKNWIQTQVAAAESEGSLGAAADAGATDDGTEAVEATRLDDDAAAARIQARHRGRADRRKVAEMNGVADAQSEGTVNAAEADETHSGNDVQSTGMDEDTAAARIQAIQRGKMARKEQQEMTAAATRIQSVHRGKASRRAQPKIEDRLLGWSQDWYIAMQTIATATGVPFMQSKFQDLTAQETAFLKQKFELVKQQRFEGGEADFWKFVASSFSKADLGRTGMLDFESFEKLCASIFGSFGDLQEATGESLQEFFRRADADQSGKVSFAELVAVFVVDEQRSPALKNWIQTQVAAAEQNGTATVDTQPADGRYDSEQSAAMKIQARHRGNQSRKHRQTVQLARRDDDDAARRIQSIHRGRAARNKTRQMRLDRDVREQTNAAVRIQAVHRGREARRSTAQLNAPLSEVAQVSHHERLAQKLDGRLEQLETGAWVQQQEEEMEREDSWRAEQAQAATRIQARQRGKQARRQATILQVDTDVGASMESLENSEASPPVQPWPAGHSPTPQKSRLPLPAAGHMSMPPKVRFGAESPQPMPPLEPRNTPPNEGRSLQIQRGHAAPLDSISSHRPEYPEEPDYNSDPFVVAMNGKREKIEQQVAALQSRIVEQTVVSAKGVDLDTADSDGILEEVKVFGALNAQMEQLVSLENEFLRGMPHTLSFLCCAELHRSL